MGQTKQLIYRILFFCAFPALFSFSGTMSPAVFVLAQEPTPAATQPQIPNPALQEAANQAAEHARKLGCNSANCLVLILDFMTTDQATSVAGSQLARDFGLLLAKPLAPARVVDATTLRIFQVEERIPSRYLDDAKAARWLGTQFRAGIVLQGKLDFSRTPPTARFVLLDLNAKKRTEDFKIQLPGISFSPEQLKPSEPYPPLTPLTVDRNGTILFKWPNSAKSTKPPHCSHIPSPAYTQAAREAGLNGSLTVETIITQDNRMENVRIVKGMPYDLNQSALDILQNWRCTPATVDGQAVPTLVQFEVTFRFY